MTRSFAEHVVVDCFMVLLLLGHMLVDVDVVVAVVVVVDDEVDVVDEVDDVRTANGNGFCSFCTADVPFNFSDCVVVL